MDEKERQELEDKRNKARFAPFRYSLGDPYQSPNGPYFVASMFVSAGNCTPLVPISQRDRVGLPSVPDLNQD